MEPCSGQGTKLDGEQDKVKHLKTTLDCQGSLHKWIIISSIKACQARQQGDSLGCHIISSWTSGATKGHLSWPQRSGPVTPEMQVLKTIPSLIILNQGKSYKKQVAQILNYALPCGA